MKTKKNNKLWHCLLLLTSSEYREGLEYDEGEELWKHVNKGLANPEGNAERDKQRLCEFADRFKHTLTRTEQRVLANWMKKRLESLQQEDPEEVSPQIIAYEQKWIRIYQQHLNAIN